MKIKALTIIALSLLATFAIGCTSTVVDKSLASDEARSVTTVGELKQKPKVGVLRRNMLDNRAYQYYISGVFAEEFDDLTTSADFYKTALSYFPESYEIGYSLAEVYYRLREPEKSLDLLRKLVPRDAEVYRLSAACYRVIGDATSYRASYLNLIKVDNDDISAYQSLAHAYIQIDNLDSALWAFEHVVRLDPFDFKTITQVGRLYAEAGRIEEAKSLYEQSLDVNKSIENLVAMVALGDLYAAEGNADSADVWYKSALDTDPDNTLLLNLMVSQTTGKDDYAGALQYARRLVELSPGDFAQMRRLGMIYYYADSLSMADSIFHAVVSGGDIHDLNHHFLGMIASEREEYEKARDEFLIMTRLADTMTVSWANLGFAYRNLDQPDKEIEAYIAGIEKVKSSEGEVRLLFALGSTYERNNYYQEAIETFEKVLAIDEDYHPVLNYLGYMLADKGERLEYALELISRAVEMSPNNTAYLDSYGWVYFKLGDFEKAIYYLKKAAELDSDPVMFDHLGDAFEATGEHDLARQWWEKALELDSENMVIREKLNR